MYGSISTRRGENGRITAVACGCACLAAVVVLLGYNASTSLYTSTAASIATTSIVAPVPSSAVTVSLSAAYAIPARMAPSAAAVADATPAQATALAGGVFVCLGALVALWRAIVAAPAAESLVLLPLTSVRVSPSTPEEVGGNSGDVFTFDNLRAAPGSRHRKKRKGRGHAAGQGATCGFGTRGQKSRKGNSVRPGFEGGQNPLWRRTPKLRGRALGPGHKRIEYQMVSLMKLTEQKEGSTVQFDDLSGAKPVLFKVGGVRSGDSCALPKNLTVKAHAFTRPARTAIEEAGGKCIVIDKRSRELGADGKAVGAAEKVAMMSFTSKVIYYNSEQTEPIDPDWIDETEEPDVAMFAATGRKAKVGVYKEPAPLSTKLSEAKKAIIDQVHGQLKDSYLVFGFSMKGYTHGQITKLRRSMPAGVKIQVVKNTLFRIASRGTGFEALDPLTVDSKAWVFVPEASFQDAIKTYSNFLKDTKRQDLNPILGGSIESSLLTEPQVMAISEMPTKKELIAKIAFLIKAIPTRVARVVKANPQKLAVAIKLATEKGSGSAATA